MGMASVTEIGTLIDRDPKIRGGRPKIAGTGLTVSRIAGWYKMGMTPEEIQILRPQLPAKIEANSLREDGIHLLHRGRIARLDLFHETGPGLPRRRRIGLY